jgi:hypothetical protein
LERIADVKRNQRSRGRYLGGTVPFGYRLGEGGELVGIPEQQETHHERPPGRRDVAPADRRRGREPARDQGQPAAVDKVLVEARRLDAKYCSAACRQRGYRERGS